MGQVRHSNGFISCESDSVVHSYLLELRNIAINLQSLSSSTLAKLKKAAILVGSQRAQRQRSDRATDPADGDEDNWDLVYNLLPPSQVAIADNMIALQQFGREVFCAPQEEILEGEHNSTCS